MFSPSDLTYPEHLDVGLGKYAQAQAQRQPDFGGVNQLFASMGRMGPMVRGGQFMDPQQAQQYATPSYLTARGDIAQGNIQNMFALAQLMNQIGGLRGQTAAMIPELQAQGLQTQTGSLFGGLF